MSKANTTHTAAPQDANPRVPEHVAIIMDGNGRWAVNQGKKRVQGHKKGMERAREVAEYCGKHGVTTLTLFAFSSENWNRPAEEVNFLMDLFISGLTREVKKLSKNNVRLVIIGERSRFDAKLQQSMADAEALTRDNDGMNLVVAVNYGGRWDITQAAQRILNQRQAKNSSEPVTEQELEAGLSTAEFSPVDLLIRTGGEHRISNFLLWQAAYAELYFSDALWPDFDASAMQQALDEFARRERRFGLTSAQVQATEETDHA